MELRLITANVCDGEKNYGASITCFGIATNEESQRSIESEVRFRGFEPSVIVIQADVVVDEYLGGYVE